MTAKRRIGLLTSGGDCAGLNAALRSVVLRAVSGHGWEVIGITNGTLGLLERPIAVRTLTPADFDGTLLRQSGTMLGSTNTGNPFEFELPDGSIRDCSSKVVETMRELKLDGLIGVRGDGSLALLKRLADQAGMPLICIPKTIDNDIPIVDSQQSRRGGW